MICALPACLKGARVLVPIWRDIMNYVVSKPFLELILASLKLFAIFGAYLELMGDDKRKKFEDFMFQSVPRLVRSTAIMFVIFVVLVITTGLVVDYIALALPFIAIWLIGFRGFPIYFFFLGNQSVGPLLAVIGVISLVLSLLTWLISLQNVVWLSHLLQYALNEAFSFIGVSAYLSRMPDATDLYTKYAATTDWLYGYTKNWWFLFRWTISFSIFYSDGGFALILVMTQVLRIVLLVLIPVLILFVPIYLFLRWSDWLQSRLNAEGGKLPVGAFSVYAAGEIGEYILKLHNWYTSKLT